MAGVRRVEPGEAAFRAAAEGGGEQQKTHERYDSSAHGGDLIAAHALCHGRAMPEDDVREAIARLEEEIDRLILRRERCRKLSRAAKVAVVVGGVWLACTLVGLVYFWPSLFLAALAAVIGGIVLLGSNATTWEQTDAALDKANAARSALIGGIDLRVVDGGMRQVR